MLELLNYMKKVAIFDVDGTVFRSSLLVELVNALIKSELFPKSAPEGYVKQYTRWLDRKGGYDEYIAGVVDVFLKHIKGIPYGEFNDVVKTVVEEKKDRIYIFTRDLIRDLKKDDYFLLAISQSPKGILDEFCKRLGFDKIYGRFYELGPQNQFTGNVIDLHLIANKGSIVKRAVLKERLTLKGSIGVGDTKDDIPFLELVERPICFNPNSELYRYAKINKWEVVVELKDVVYHL